MYFEPINPLTTFKPSGDSNIIVLFVVLILAIFPPEIRAQQVATGNLTDQPVARKYFRSLEDLGFKQGFRFEGPSIAHTKSFSFSVPRDSIPRSARFILTYRASSIMSEKANLRIEANNRPLVSRLLAKHNALQEVQVEIPKSLFEKGQINITIQASLPLSNNRCFDERVEGSFLYMLPDSGLELVYDNINSMRDAWLTLPRQVTLSLPPGNFTADSFSMTLALYELLYRKGHKIKFVRLPELGDIVIGEQSSIAQAVALRLTDKDKNSLEKTRNFMPSSDHSIYMVKAPADSFIAISPPFNAHSLALLSGNWQVLATGDKFLNNLAKPPVTNLRLQANETGAFTIPLESLGMDTQPRSVASQAEWFASFTSADLPPKARPDRIYLKIITPVHDTDQQSYEMYIYLNDILLQSELLKPTGQYQEIAVFLPKIYQQQVNYLKVLVQREGKKGDCLGPVSKFPIQLSPESELITTNDESMPDEFADLPRYLSDGFDVYLSNAFLESPEALQLLGSVSANFSLAIDFERITFHDADEKLNPQGAFIAAGDLNFSNVDFPVQFDTGAIQLVDKNGNLILDVDSLENQVIIQLGKGRSASGLWARTTDKGYGFDVSNLSISKDDVAFVDHSGVIMTIDSKAPTLARVFYPEVSTWLDTLSALRFWILSVAWLLLTLIVIYLYKKSRQHDKTEVTSNEEPDEKSD